MLHYTIVTQTFVSCVILAIQTEEKCKIKSKPD